MSIGVREARSLIRKARRRVPEGEAITHLNIVSMMDMMTIPLVFMIKSLAPPSEMDMRAVPPPQSSTRMTVPESATSVTIAKTAILVEGAPIVAVKNGDGGGSAKA